MTPENGILTLVPGQCIAEGSRRLPPASDLERTVPVREVLVHQVPDLGDVRITYRLDTYRHGRSRRWYWLAIRADLAAAAGEAAAVAKE